MDNPTASASDDRELFLDTPLYREINSEAQKEFATNIKSPALSWHMSFLVNQTGREHLNSVLDIELLKLIRVLLNSSNVYPWKEGGEKVDVNPSTAQRVILLDGIYEISHLRKIDPQSVPRCKCSPRELHLLDSQARLIVLSFAWKREPSTLGLSIRVRLSANILSITVLAESQNGPCERSDITIGDFKYLTRDFWEDDFIREFLFSNSELKGLFNHEVFKAIFADVRGVIIPREYFSDYHRYQEVKGKTCWGEHMMESLRPVVTEDDNHECSASYMLGRRALFITALAPQPLDKGHEEWLLESRERPRAPLTYLFVLQTKSQDTSRYPVDERQLGHTVDRMHLIATLRHAALLDLNRLRKAGSDLSRIDKSFENARKDIDKYDKDELIVEEVRKSIERARKEFDKITEEFLKDNPGGIGITFRIESSRNYHSQFQKNLPALRIKRVEGYRPYTHFVDRRLGAAFESIDRLGVRYERATNALAEIDLRFSAIQARKNGAILAATAAEVTKTTSLLAKNGVALADIQRYGEVVLLIILVPYYLTGLVEHVFERSPADHPLHEPLSLAVLLILVLSFGLIRSAVLGAGDMEMDLKLKRTFRIVASMIFLMTLSLFFKFEGIEISERLIVLGVALGGLWGCILYIAPRLLKAPPEYFAIATDGWIRPTRFSIRPLVALAIAGLVVLTLFLALTAFRDSPPRESHASGPAVGETSSQRPASLPPPGMSR